MTVQTPASRATTEVIQPIVPASAVSWPAIIAGAFTAAAISLILVLLGAGFGLGSVSAWSGRSVSITSFTVGAAIWLIVVQWLAAALGGYLTGRLRTRWHGLHTHEAAFRDTAHGFLAWALATGVIALLFGSAVSGLVGGTARTAATAASGAAQNFASSGMSAARQFSAYSADTLFRSPDPGGNDTANADTRAEASRILARSAADGETSKADRDYLVALVAGRTGLSSDDAGKLVDQVIADEKSAQAKIRDAADMARKAVASASIFLAVSMLVGAFIAAAAAALGGLRRDEHI